MVAPNGMVRRVGQHGMLLGLSLDAELTDTAVDMAAGELLVLYTDGLIEWPSRADTEAPFRELLFSLGGCSAEEAVQAIESWWREGTGSKARDDAAVLVVRACH
jgi:serine phosphatase RsbU (regulator of sigma subunit)